MGDRIPCLLIASASRPANGSEETTGVSGWMPVAGSGGGGGAGRGAGVETAPGNCACDPGPVEAPVAGGCLGPQADKTVSSPATYREEREERDIGIRFLWTRLAI